MNEREITGMCRSTSSTLPKRKKELNEVCEEVASRERVESETNELRNRLGRRNALLDVIRKAYHRDVLAVKECLIDAQRKGLVANPGSIDSLLDPSLASIPSIDLRETFRLFAPQECELRVRPCWKCGGRLEVIHRESARIVNFKHSIQSLEEKEKDLRLELVDTKVKAQEDRECLVEATQRINDERDVLLEQIMSLKHQVADRNALDGEVKQLNLNKKRLENTLERQQPIIVDHKRLVVEIEKVKDDRKQWKGKYQEQVEQNTQFEKEKEALAQQVSRLQGENKELRENFLEARENCQKSEDRCSTLTQDLSKSKTATQEIECCLQKAEQAIDELESEHQQEKHQMESQINNLESKCSDLQVAIANLEDESRTNAKEAEYYRKKIEATLEGARKRGSIAFVPRHSDAAFAKTDELIRESENLRQKTGMLFNLLLSCIRSTYENCLVQEKLLVDNGSELHKNSRKLKTSSETTNNKARLVLEHLRNADESDMIKWVSILADETDQRHILGNLQNRLQMGQFSLDKTFQKIYKEQATEMRKSQDEHHRQMEERRSRIWELEKMLTEAITVNRKYEDNIVKMKEKYDRVEPVIDSIRCVLRKSRRDCVENNDTTSKLRVEYEKLSLVINKLLDKLRTSKEKIQAQEEDLADRKKDIYNRDMAIEQLEKLLEKITHKYAENERLRIKVTDEVGIQAVPAIANAASHADFLPTPLRGVILAESENKNPSNALIPGRIFDISDIDVQKSGLQYRRAIDRL